MARSFLSDCLTATCRHDLLRTEQSQSMASRNDRRNFFFFSVTSPLVIQGKYYLIKVEFKCLPFVFSEEKC